MKTEDMPMGQHVTTWEPWPVTIVMSGGPDRVQVNQKKKKFKRKPVGFVLNEETNHGPDQED